MQKIGPSEIRITPNDIRPLEEYLRDELKPLLKNMTREELEDHCARLDAVSKALFKFLRESVIFPREDFDRAASIIGKVTKTALFLTAAIATGLFISRVIIPVYMP